MWVVSNVGFFSIVHKPEDPGELTIRARVREDLEALKEFYLPSMSDIIESDDSDYRYRGFASYEAVGAALGEISDDIDYRNFKNEILLKYGAERATIYSEVWGRLFRLRILDH